jgi:2-phospho-L-lactate transferase/gluconeogenesis factor (CofD/UPF0052 family)
MLMLMLILVPELIQYSRPLALRDAAELIEPHEVGVDNSRPAILHPTASKVKQADMVILSVGEPLMS